MDRHTGGDLGEALRYHAATAQFLSGNYPRALELFQALDEKGPKDPLRRYAVREGIGNTYEAQGDFPRAAEFYERLAEEAPEEQRVPAVLAQAARCYEKAGNFASVERLAARLVDEFGETQQWAREGARLAARAKTMREMPPQDEETSPEGSGE
jgi:TolA-binding protein